MMFSKNEQRLIKEIFKKAYDEREKPAIGDRWQTGVMHRIRRLGSIASKRSFFLGFEQFVWRLAPVTCLIIIVLATLLYKIEVVPDDTVFQVLMNGEEELTIYQLVGV